MKFFRRRPRPVPKCSECYYPVPDHHPRCILGALQDLLGL